MSHLQMGILHAFFVHHIYIPIVLTILIAAPIFYAYLRMVKLLPRRRGQDGRRDRRSGPDAQERVSEEHPTSSSLATSTKYGSRAAHDRHASLKRAYMGYGVSIVSLLIGVGLLSASLALKSPWMSGTASIVGAGVAMFAVFWGWRAAMLIRSRT